MEPITVVDKEREYEENFLKDGFEFCITGVSIEEDERMRSWWLKLDGYMDNRRVVLPAAVAKSQIIVRQISVFGECNTERI